MAITYTWDVNTLDTAVSEDGLENVVKIIHWRLSATDGTYKAESYSTVSLDPPSADNFTNFNSLTEEQVIAWLESKLDVDDIKQNLDRELAALAEPPIVTKKAPWL